MTAKFFNSLFVGFVSVFRGVMLFPHQYTSFWIVFKQFLYVCFRKINVGIFVAFGYNRFSHIALLQRVVRAGSERGNAPAAHLEYKIIFVLAN